jgi:T4 beta protein
MRYMPILKGKLAEYKALEDLAPELRAQMVPLIDLLPVAEDLVSRAVNSFPPQRPSPD